jgi:hypothetical protein
MNTIDCVLERTTQNELERIVEPLVSYICAAEKPRCVLLSAVSALFREVEATNKAAAAHFHAYLEG